MEDKIIANAELVRRVAREQLDVLLQYDVDGVQWLDGYINRQRQHGNEAVIRTLPSTLGAFLGECIRHVYGGRWVEDSERRWMVKVNEKLSVYPFSKVEKQLLNGEGDSVFGLFTAIQALLHDASVGEAVTPSCTKAVEKRHWWKFW
jgi:hypothetical protein